MNNQKYIRQTRLAEVGEKGQEKLNKVSVLIVGCGGLGGEVAVHLAASGIGKLCLADFDTVSESNLHRQVFFKEENLGQLKTKTLQKYIKQQNSDVFVECFEEAIVKTNVRQLIQQFDYILDCTDSLETKYLINDACVLENKILIYASLHKYEGQVAVFNFKDNQGKRTANLRDVFPEMPVENIPSCSEVGTLNTIVSLIASLQSNEVLKLILGIGKPLVNCLLIYQSLDNNQLNLKLKVNEDLNFVSLWNANTYKEENCGFLNELQIDKERFQERLQEGNIKVISVLDEDLNLDFKVDVQIPFSEIELGNYHLETNDYVVVCRRGKTSMKAIRILQNKYPESSFMSLAGGLDELQ